MSDNVYQIITKQIQESLNKGVIPWRKPWSMNANIKGFVAMPRNFKGEPYRGSNVFILLSRGFESPFFATKKTVKECGGRVKDGEWSNGTRIIYWKPSEDPVEVDDSGKPKTRMILRYYYVYNLDQTEGVTLPKKAQDQLDGMAKKRLTKPQRLKKAEAIVKGYADAPKVFEDVTGEAYYSILNDEVHMPPAEDFPNAENRYYTLFHELAHSTLHRDRLNRRQQNPGENVNHGYGREELVAEMTNAFLCAHADFSPAVVDNQAAYIAGWLKTIAEDEKMFVVCAAAAQKAADYILGIKFNYDSKKESASASKVEG